MNHFGQVWPHPPKMIECVTSIASSLHYLTHNSTHCWDKTSWLTIWYHLVTWGVQLIFPLHRWYRPSVALWWYVLLRILVELFVSQGLLFHEGNYLFDEHRLICCNIPCFFWKKSTWSKGSKDGNSSLRNCFIIIVLQSSGRKFYSLDVQGNK